ncbi:MAG: type II toxin-antitoxin system RelE/ParE family toxin [Pasteurella sp.]|nr:type II toxin-antitoxin system RelE/ParE family toxin [Pasteurella sp.]
MNKLVWTVKATKQLLKIDRRYIKSIKDSVATLVNFPDVYLDIKKLKGSQSQYRIRVGKYRIIFEVIDDEPRIISIQTIKRRNEQTYN